ncbi:MAG: methionyl-tRNA formyltransferase, partial [Clostridiaceae bacterium]
KLIESMNPDFIVVVAYGQILPKRILDIPKYGSINLHASLLPYLRGAAPIQASIIQGFEETGNTTMYMAEGLDTGDMLLKNVVDIKEDMTFGMLHNELMNSGAELLIHTLMMLKDGCLGRTPQDDSIATYVPKMSKEDALLDFNEESIAILNKIRGYNPIPLAYTYQDGNMIKIVSAKIGDAKGIPGQIISMDKDGITVGTKDSSIIIKELQIPGKKTMKVRDFLNGNKLDSNKLFNKE